MTATVIDKRELNALLSRVRYDGSQSSHEAMVLIRQQFDELAERMTPAVGSAQAVIASVLRSRAPFDGSIDELAAVIAGAVGLLPRLAGEIDPDGQHL